VFVPAATATLETSDHGPHRGENAAASCHRRHPRSEQAPAAIRRQFWRGNRPTESATARAIRAGIAAQKPATCC